MNTYIIHYDKLIERRRYLENLVRNPIWISETSKDNMSTEIRNKFYDMTKNLWENRCSNIYTNLPEYRTLNDGDISCCINHLEAWKKFSIYEDSLGLFLEDDVILCDDFYHKLSITLDNSPKFDILFLGGGFHHSVAKTIESVRIDKVSYLYKDHPSTNCVCSYILTKNLSIKLLDFYAQNKFCLPIDYEMNYLLKKFNCKILHIDPYLCSEGSAIGKYKSSQVRQ